MDALLLPDPIVIVSHASPRDLHAWTAGVSGTWATNALPVQFRVGLPRSRDVGADEDAELDVALRAWPGVSCTAWRAKIGAPTNAPPGDDGINAVYFDDATWPSTLPPGVIATTVIHTDSFGRYHDADIHLNGAQYTFSLDGRAGTKDLRSILTHELGHALGLGHSSELRATMYASNAGGVAWRSLEKDDQDGVCALYAGAGLIAGCDARACPTGFKCVATSCERIGEMSNVCSPCMRVVGACDGAGDDARCIDIAGGRVCGRACVQDVDCGSGFHCKPTTLAGDTQCVSDNACKNGPDTCAKDTDCVFGTCANGACVGPGDLADAGTSPDASDAGQVLGSGVKGGCTQSGNALGSSWIWLLAWFLVRRRLKPS